MWQKLVDELQGHNFTVLAVAMDASEAARPWIEAARPSYPCVIDRDHYVADLYNMVNVPQAVWIDEAGHIVRPPENAGASDAFRYRDRATGHLASEHVEARESLKSAYVEAVRDWVLRGAESDYALDADAARAQLSLPDQGIAQAHVHFRLAQRLLSNGNPGEAALHFGEASRLHPDSWNIWRQAARKEASGLAAGVDFWDRVNALGDRPYYVPNAIMGAGSRT